MQGPAIGCSINERSALGGRLVGGELSDVLRLVKGVRGILKRLQLLTCLVPAMPG